MEQQTALQLLNSLEMLNNNLRILAILCAAILLMMLIAAGAYWRRGRRLAAAATSTEPTQASNPEIEEPFDADRADDLYARDQLDELLQYCNDNHDRFPNEVAVYWFLGLAYYRRNEYPQAKINFEHVVELNPAWKESVSGYLEAITENNLLHEQPLHPLQ